MSIIVLNMKKTTEAKGKKTPGLYKNVPSPITNKELKRRIIEISYELKLSHIGSNLTALDIIKEIYDRKKPDEKFVLSAGHAHLAHLIVMEKYSNKFKQVAKDITEQLAPFVDPEFSVNKYGIHCDRQAGCDVSTGSLGQGLPIAVGMALADRSKNVYCLISDGECSEGSIWEAIRIANEQELNNLYVYCNFNGWGAYKEISINKLKDRFYGIYGTNPIITFVETNLNGWPKWIQGQNGHYHVMNEKEYKEALEVLK